MYDVVIIGAGVTGSASARELSRYNLKVCVLEKEEDVCCGTSKANSGIVHSGIDCRPGTRMAEMNLLGNAMMEPLSKELDFEFQRNGSLVLCFSEAEMPKLRELYEQGLANKVPDIRIIDKKELHEMEPNVSDEAVAALYAPTGGIVCPFGLTIAMAENAADNGVEFRFDSEVRDIIPIDGGYQIKIVSCENQDRSGQNAGSCADRQHADASVTEMMLKTKCIVNAAGVYADRFHNMVSSRKIHIIPRRGEYCLLDKTTGGIVHSTIFQLPGKQGKGVLVTPTVHGNTLVGPTADDHEEKDAVNTTADGISRLCASAQRSVPSVPLRQVITSFSGNRAHEDHHDFIIEELSDAPGFIDAAGIESPGLTSAPAIGIRVAEIVAGLLHPDKNPNFDGKRTGILNPKNLSEQDYAALIQKNPAYGSIVCRCETITEGEIVDAITRTLGAKSLDGVKRRTRAGMGRCQAGFCSPKTMEIIAREKHISQLSVTKSGKGSHMVIGYSKKSVQEGEL